MGKLIPNQTASRTLIDYLKLEGVDRIWGVPGGAVIELINDLRLQAGDADAIDFVVCRHETGAAYIAHGYAAVGDNLGVVLTTAGPSATNMLTGLMNAEASNVGVLGISGEIPTKFFGEGYLQEGVDANLDIKSVFANAITYSTLIANADAFETLFRQALRTCRSQPARAAHVSLTNDAASSCINADGSPIDFPESPMGYRAVPSGTDVRLAATLAEAFASAETPLFFFGNGARRALRDPARLQRLIDISAANAWPVMTTPDAKGIFPEDHPMSLRSYGMCGCPWTVEYMAGKDKPHYDTLAVFGSALGELATSVEATGHYSSRLLPSAFFCQVDLDQSSIGRTFEVDLGIVGDCGATLDAFFDALDGMDATNVEPRRVAIQELKATTLPWASEEQRSSTAAPVQPAALAAAISDALVGGGHIWIDAGNCVGWSLNNMVITQEMSYHSALDMGPMGFGVCAVIGGKAALPDVPHVALVGDGAFMMQGAEISTAAQQGIGAIWVVLNDNDLAMVSQGMSVLFKPAAPWKDYYKLGNPDLVKFSEALGATGYRIDSTMGLDAFNTALEAAIAGGAAGTPQVIVVDIDTEPMPPYGWPTLTPTDCAPTKKPNEGS